MKKADDRVIHSVRLQLFTNLFPLDSLLKSNKSNEKEKS